MNLSNVIAILWPCIVTAQIGSEKAISKHLHDGEEFQISLPDLLKHGEDLFRAAWTVQEGGGRHLTKGTGAASSDPIAPLVFPGTLAGFPRQTPTPALAATPSLRLGAGAISSRTSLSSGSVSISRPSILPIRLPIAIVRIPHLRR